MDRLKLTLAGCGLAVLVAAPGCRNLRSEVPAGRPYTSDGRQMPSVGFSSDPHPPIGGAVASAPGAVGMGTAEQPGMTGQFGTPAPGSTGNYGAPTSNAYGPPGTSSLGSAATPPPASLNPGLSTPAAVPPSIPPSVGGGGTGLPEAAMPPR
jgi:hypothetical protein